LTQQRALYVLVFLAGVGTLATEICASRLLAPYFGSSTIVWANLIGLVLASLSLGYWLGGKLADRRPEARLLGMIVLAAALLMPSEPGVRPSGRRLPVGLALLVLAAVVALNGLGLPWFVQAAAVAAAVGAFFLVRRQKRLVGWGLVAGAVAILLTRGGDVRQRWRAARVPRPARRRGGHLG